MDGPEKIFTHDATKKVQQYHYCKSKMVIASVASLNKAGIPTENSLMTNMQCSSIFPKE